eukprot:6182940-Pleurochrysis_carterae.AAC.3
MSSVAAHPAKSERPTIGGASKLASTDTAWALPHPPNSSSRSRPQTEAATGATRRTREMTAPTCCSCVDVGDTASGLGTSRAELTSCCASCSGKMQSVDSTSWRKSFCVSGFVFLAVEPPRKTVPDAAKQCIRSRSAIPVSASSSRLESSCSANSAEVTRGGSTSGGGGSSGCLRASRTLLGLAVSELEQRFKKGDPRSPGAGDPLALVAGDACAALPPDCRRAAASGCGDNPFERGAPCDGVGDEELASPRPAPRRKAARLRAISAVAIFRNRYCFQMCIQAMLSPRSFIASLLTANPPNRSAADLP